MVVETVFAPQRACRQLRLLVVGLVETHLDRWIVWGQLTPLAPRIKQAALYGQDAVEGRDDERRPGSTCFLLEERNQLQRHAARAEQLFTGADAVELLDPLGEGCGILLPGGTCGGVQIARSRLAEQLMRFHGQRGDAAARGFEQGGRMTPARGDLFPDVQLLAGIEQQAVIEAALRPGVAREASPIEDVRRGPRSKSFGATGAIEGGGKSTRGAIAGGDDGAAIAQPGVEFRLRQRAHGSVIPRRRAAAPTGATAAADGCKLR